MIDVNDITLTQCRVWEWRKLARLCTICFPKMSVNEISYILRHHRRHIRVAKLRGAIVGYWINNTGHAPGLAWLEQIGVSPRSRRTGLGRLLLADYEATVRHQGFTRIEFAVDRDNASAIELYSSCGFAPVSHPGARVMFGKELGFSSGGPAQSSALDVWLARTWFRVLFDIIVRPGLQQSSLR